VEPQVTLELAGMTIRPDLVDRELRIMVEADSFAFHSSAAMLLKDCRRYTVAAASGWRVARFGYRHVRHEQDWVREMLARMVAG
jgi:very-short-patch-repair endonuclease